MHPFLVRWRRLTDHLSSDFLGGPRVVRLAWSVNLQKGGTLPFVVALVFAFATVPPPAGSGTTMLTARLGKRL